MNIRTATYSPKLANTNKLDIFNAISYLKTYVNQTISLLEQEQKISPTPGKQITDKIDLPARLSQLVAKQASSVKKC